MPIYDDYAEYTQQAKRDYGEKTLVMMEVGSFWEIYDCDQHLGADMDSIGQLLGIQISRKNKSIPEVSRTNPQMAGFPTHALGRFQPLLLDAGYTIVYVGQITPPPNPKRGITKVVSKGTYMDPSDIESSGNTNGTGLATLYLSCSSSHTKLLVTAAVAILEVSTGRSIVYETSSSESLYRFLYAQRPVEILVFGGSSGSSQVLHSWMEVITRACHEQAVVHMRCEDALYAKPYEDLAYQNQVLRKVFCTGSGSGGSSGQDMGMLTPIEYLDLERYPFLVVAYTALLQFAYAHDETILARLQKPMLETDANLLQLCYNASQQLDLQGLDRLLNTCVTAMGRRAFTRQLTHPIYDPKQLEQRYDAIDAMRQQQVFIQVRSHLAKVYDLERLFRRVYMQSAEPHHLRSILQSLSAAKEAIACLPEPGKMSRIPFQRMHTARHGIDDILAFFITHLDLNWNTENKEATDALTEGTLEDIVESASQPNAKAFFRSSLYPELDAMQQAYRQPLQDIQAVCQCVQDQVPQACLKLECNDRDGYYYVLTQKRFKDFQAQMKACTVLSASGRELVVADLLPHATTTGSTTKLAKCSWLNVLNERLQEAREAFRRQLRAVYASFLTELSDQLASRSDAILEQLCQMDIASSMAKQAEAYAYVRPVLIQINSHKGDPDASASMDAKGIRHPIIERMHDQVPYVANDVAIGGPSYGTGILLYGLNAAGKSSLMKAVGLNILLAQAGFFVAATQFTLCPYRKLYTRITHQDDLYRGQSTFMVEMSELRSILKGADPWSIVLGDELCSGTEAISATAIVAAGIATLCKRQVSFLFATHLHDLLEVEAVQHCVHDASSTPPALRVYHLHVEYDEQTDKLVYDRTLKSGEGHRLYGLEVCKSLGMDAEFMQLADQIRRIRTGVPEAILPAKKSRYNAKLFVDQHCAVCKAHDKSIEVHHITEQHTFRKIELDNNKSMGMSKQKNRLSNMVCLCSACHDALHSGKINIRGYRQTSQGIELDMEGHIHL